MNRSPRQSFIGLALSGGGARAIAFHLGCLRALHDRGILSRVKVLSTVSGGSVIGACYAYSSDDFETFDARVVKLLRAGIQRSIVREVLLSPELAKISLTLIVSGVPTLALWSFASLLALLRTLIAIPTRGIEQRIAAIHHSLPVWGSMTTAFERALTRLIGPKTVSEVSRAGLHVVINACELRTGTAFRFGSQRSGGWRYGQVSGAVPTVAKAVAASAAFPMLLPPLIEKFEFTKGGRYPGAIRRPDRRGSF